MTPAESQLNSTFRPRVGIPWRTTREEAENNRPKIQNYAQAVVNAGGEPVLLPLTNPAELHQALPTLDAFVLPGSPSDVEPREYGSENHGLSEAADLNREKTDRAILQHAFAENKPVLAICYGCQLLNVYLGGTLIQDLKAETGTATPHRKKDVAPQPKDDPCHGATLEPGSRLAAIAQSGEAVINSSHHQAIREPGKNLRITSHASDGTVEGVEWTGDSNWVVGVQWHPERMFGDAFSERLFQEFVAAARSSRGEVAHKK
ncbi:MAG TPA: gamma-glutamyl-gamma-aminobutyrate hydrolase family protein [Methylomirabilota bacterium]|nr:gamma-glutamyl-gamma-aminobutyrate hydrolase family protein [Methylomirabilota bacterium]